MYATSDTFIQPDSAKTCIVNNERGEILKVCCADFEEKGDGCRACLKGFTSDMGQNCRRCPKHSYGEKCYFVCSCTDTEMCHHVQGCVPSPSTASYSVYATSATLKQGSKGKSCHSENKSGEKLCCADYEEKGNTCIPCSKGYTSKQGHNCTPCPLNTRGERCGSDCSCLGFQICDHVKGCVAFPLTTDTSVYATSHDRTSKLITETGTYSGSDITSAYDKETKGCSVQGLLSREIIVYSTLSVVVIVFGICLCFVFLKYKSLTKKKVITINQTQHSSISQQTQNIEIADRLYEIINEEYLLDDRRLQQIQKEMSSEYLDGIHDSNIRDSCISKSLDNQDNLCQLLSIIQTQDQVRNLKVEDRSLMSGDSTSSSDEYQWDSTQDYLNPYQPMIAISPPLEHKYFTIATTHSRKDGNNKDSEAVTNEFELQHPHAMEKDDLTNLHDNYKSFPLA